MKLLNRHYELYLDGTLIEIRTELLQGNIRVVKKLSDENPEDITDSILFEIEPNVFVR